MEEKYRLIYFNATGLAEPIRYLFAYGKIPYEDCRFEYTEWIGYKHCTPFGQVPVLEINGKSYCQSSAICRFLAKRFNLLGKTDEDAFQADIIVDTITDYRLNEGYRLQNATPSMLMGCRLGAQHDLFYYSAYFKIKCPAKKEEKLRDIKKIHTPYYFSKFDKIVEENGGYFVNHQMSWVDIFFAALSDLWIRVSEEPILACYPHLDNLKKTIDNEPNIKAYRDQRPETLF